jgi:RND family efflux transporter MFP subunit
MKIIERLRVIIANLLKLVKKRWKWVVIFLIIISIAGVLIFRQQSNKEPELAYQNPQVKDLEKTLSISGIVDSKEKARLRFLSGGKVEYLGAKEGDLVKKGQTIATIDITATQKQLEQDLNNFLRQRLDYDQTNVNIYEDSMYTLDEERIKEKSQLDLRNQALNVEIRTEAINSNRISAPFNGVLTTSPTNVTGVQLTGGEYFEVVNPESLIFKATVDELDLAGLKTGQPAVFELDAVEDEIFETTLNYISYTATNTSTKTVFLVEFPIDLIRYGTDIFRIGMNGEARITIDTRSNVLTIPLEATRERNDKTYVDIAKDGNPKSQETQEREILVGMVANDEIEVLSGLSKDDFVVIP